jgi:radical SAM protein with 4Fe4S-binding SPASM domain
MIWKPTTLWWIITGNCNLHCKHCYIEAPAKKYGQVSTKDAFFIIEKIINHGITNFFITGGEPFLRNDILDIFQRIIDKGGRITGLDSNGTIINNEIILFLKKNNIFVNISHDGLNFTNKNRGGSIEKKVLDTINLLVNNNIKTNINSSLNPHNLNSLIELFDILKNIKINQWLLFTPFNTGNYLENYRELSIKDEADFYKKIYVKWLNANKPFEIRLGNTFDSTNPETEWENYVCEYFRDTITLFPDGQITPCCKYIIHNDYKNFPNIFDDDLKQVFHYSILSEIKNQLMVEVLNYNPECKNCKLLAKCNAGCRMEAYLETKDKLLKDIRNCNLMKETENYYK